MKTAKEIQQLSKEEYKDNLHNQFFTAAPMGYIKGYTQCQTDMQKNIDELLEFMKQASFEEYGDHITAKQLMEKHIKI